MDDKLLHRWIREVRTGKRPASHLIENLRQFPFENLGFARLDTHRSLRRGLPEVILGEGKKPEHLIPIIRRFSRYSAPLLITRLSAEHFQSIRSAIPDLGYDPVGRLAYRLSHRRVPQRGLVLVLSGGTSDWPIAEEAVRALELLGNRTQRLYDVGVAGVHRLLSYWQLLRRAKVIVVIAGMEGALASVVAGIVRCPIIAVPTSIGYGAAFQGIAPLLGMMTSCAPGIGVVNIDNGFGAAYLAHLINQPARR